MPFGLFEITHMVNLTAIYCIPYKLFTLNTLKAYSMNILALITCGSLLHIWVALPIVLNCKSTAFLEYDSESFSCFMVITWPC